MIKRFIAGLVLFIIKRINILLAVAILKLLTKLIKKISRLRELNSRPFAYKAKALTTELNRLD